MKFPWMEKGGHIFCPRKFLKCICDEIESGSNVKEMTEIWLYVLRQHSYRV